MCDITSLCRQRKEALRFLQAHCASGTHGHRPLIGVGTKVPSESDKETGLGFWPCLAVPASQAGRDTAGPKSVSLGPQTQVLSLTQGWVPCDQSLFWPEANVSLP